MTNILDKLKLEKFSKIGYTKPAKEDSILDNMEFSNKGPFDLVFAYTYSALEMKEISIRLWETKDILENGQIYFLYPKLKNKLGHEGVHRDSIFPALEVDDALGYIPGTNLKFNIMRAFDDNYTLIGLKYISDKQKDKKPSNKPSMRVDDYIKYIPQIVEELKPYGLSEKFEALTFGRQKDAARHIYSARTEATKTKRIEELIKRLEVWCF